MPKNQKTSRLEKDITITIHAETPRTMEAAADRADVLRSALRVLERQGEHENPVYKQISDELDFTETFCDQFSITTLDDAAAAVSFFLGMDPEPTFTDRRDIRLLEELRSALLWMKRENQEVKLNLA
ncbi:MAG: hypothetical protein AAF850_08450 [Pseudomonadota bacterium]